jgi:hypothetical protein
VPALLHELPGRLRFSLPNLRHDSRRAAALQQRLAALPGVTKATASPMSGSVLITHDGAVATRERIIRTMESAALSRLPERPLRHRPERAAAPHPFLQLAVEKLERAIEAAITAIL